MILRGLLVIWLILTAEMTVGLFKLFRKETDSQKDYGGVNTFLDQLQTLNIQIQKLSGLLVKGTVNNSIDHSEASPSGNYNSTDSSDHNYMRHLLQSEQEINMKKSQEIVKLKEEILILRKENQKLREGSDLFHAQYNCTALTKAYKKISHQKECPPEMTR